MTPEDPQPDRSTFRVGLRLWTLAAVVIFALATVSTLGDVWLRGFASHVPSSPIHNPEAAKKWSLIMAGDAIFHTWLVYRNAYTLTHSPHRLFDTEHCAPARQTMVFSEPNITLGALAIPVALATGDPAATFNGVIILLRLWMALAMYWVVTRWTQVPAAGIVAGLLYSFHPAWTSDVTHSFIYDTSWTLLAFFFAERLFTSGRWRDAVALSLCISLQIGTSFYALTGGVLAALPYGVWLLLRSGLRSLQIAQLGFVFAITGLAVAALLGPYLAASSVGTLDGREPSNFFAWSSYLPGNALFPGWVFVALIVAALTSARSRALPGIGGDPRWAVAGGALLVIWTAAGPYQPELLGLRLPDFYSFLQSFLPGFSAVRAPSRIAVGAHLLLSLLAGIGAASILRLLRGRLATAVGVALVALVAVLTLRPDFLGFEKRLAYNATRVVADRTTIEFFASLEFLGNRGPVFELPFANSELKWTPQRILQTAYHHRRTDACTGSFRGPERERLAELAAQLPAREALIELAELGFTTIVVHHSSPRGAGQRARAAMERALAGPERVVRRVRSTRRMTAYEIELN